MIVGGNVVDALYARAEPDQMLREPIPLRSVVRA